MKERTEKEFELLFEHYPQLEECRENIAKAFELLLDCGKRGGMVMTCGDGGSAADATHIVGELMKGFKLHRPLSNAEKQAIAEAFPDDGEYLGSRLQKGIRAVSLDDQTAIGTAVANDNGADMLFAQQVYGYGREGDVLIGLSTSGNSGNVVRACQVAKAIGVKVVAMTGHGGGKMKGLADAFIGVPATETYRIQEYHLPVYHALCAMVESELFDE